MGKEPDESGDKRRFADDASAAGDSQPVPASTADSGPSGASPPTSDFVRLPKGRHVFLPEGLAGEFEAWLGHHRFRLRQGEQATLIDNERREHVLRNGRNRVGRMPGLEVVVAQHYTDVSRCHLEIIVRSSRLYALVDTSSRGTFVPHALLGDIDAES